MNAHEGVLQRILGIGIVAQDAIDAVVEEGEVGPDQRTKGVRVACGGALDQFRFSGRNFFHAVVSVSGGLWRGKPYFLAVPGDFLVVATGLADGVGSTKNPTSSRSSSTGRFRLSLAATLSAPRPKSRRSRGSVAR